MNEAMVEPAPGSTPMRKPTTEPFTNAKRQSFMSCHVGRRLRRPLGTGSMLRRLLGLHVGEHLADGEDADRDDDEVDAAQELHLAEGEARGRAEEVGAHARDPQAHQHREQRLHERIAREQHHHREAEHHEREILGCAEGERELARAAGRPASAPTTPNVPAMKEAIAAMPSAGPARPLPRHLVAVDAGHHRRRSRPGTFSRIEVVEPPYFAP